jgi:hypothetical protein
LAIHGLVINLTFTVSFSNLLFLASGMTQAIEQLPSKWEDLSSNPSTTELFIFNLSKPLCFKCALGKQYIVRVKAASYLFIFTQYDNPYL